MSDVDTNPASGVERAPSFNEHVSAFPKDDRDDSLTIKTESGKAEVANLWAQKRQRPVGDVFDPRNPDKITTNDKYGKPVDRKFSYTLNEAKKHVVPDIVEYRKNKEEFLARINAPDEQPQESGDEYDTSDDEAAPHERAARPDPAEHQAEQARHQAQQQAQYETFRAQQEHAQVVSHVQQRAQEIHGAATQVAQTAAAEFPELPHLLQQGFHGQHLYNHLVQTNQHQRAARLLEISRATDNIISHNQALHQQATEYDSQSAFVQHQGALQHVAHVEAELANRYPELKDEGTKSRIGAGITEALQERGIHPQQIGQQLLQMAPEWRSVALESLYALGAKHAAGKEMTTVREKLKGVPPVQRPGVSGGRPSSSEREIERLDARLDNAKGVNACRIAAQLTAARRRGRR
jgi:hypothetical protein